MSAGRHLGVILGELAANRELVDGGQLDLLAGELLAARHVFLAGAGRSGAAVRGFASRLMHLGLRVSLAGDVTSPHSAPGDLLVVGSGSGETGSLVALAGKAAGAGVRVALVTMDGDSALGRLADLVVLLPGTSPKLREQARRPVSSAQPMGSAFEQMSWLAYDAVVLELMERTGQRAGAMFARHADLE